ncbi:MAG: PDZ domain-containing protein [Flavobacteriaceae bacterium]
MRFTSDNHHLKIPFEWRSNLIIIPVSINQIEMNFLVDTGVGYTLIFDNQKAKQVGFPTDRPFQLFGLGSQPALLAYRATIESMTIDTIEFIDHEVLILPDDQFYLSRRLGTQIDGIIGYNLFAKYPVLIDYQRKFIHINPPRFNKLIKRKRTLAFPLSIHKRKPHIQIDFPQEKTNQNIQGTLMLDSGLSDALWLFSSSIKIKKKEPIFDDFLGTGINGNVYGQRGKLPLLRLLSRDLRDVKVAYPEVESYHRSQLANERIGSMGAELLSRFRVLFDYPNKKVYLHPTHQTKKPFYYNLSGIEFEHDGVQLVKKKLPLIARNNTSSYRDGIEFFLQDRYELVFKPALTITYVRPNSPADRAGIEQGDIIIEINGKEVYNMPLEKVHAILHKEPGKRIKMLVHRQDARLKFDFILRSIFDTTIPSP